MLKTIIIREIQEYIKSKKFLIGLLFTVLLIMLSTVINTRDFARRNQDYLDAKSQESGGHWVYVYKQPQVLSILAQGKDRKLGNRVQLTEYKVTPDATGYMGRRSQHNRYTAGFEAVDYAFVVRIVLSLFVIFLAYNAVAEEKTRGTLKLTLANHVPRHELLFGKFFGGLFVIITSLVIASIGAFLYMILHPAVTLGIPEWISVITMVGISALYLCFIYTLSLFVSVVVNSSAVSLLVLLQVWILLTVIYPNIGVLLADTSDELPTGMEITQKARDSAATFYNDSREMLKKYNETKNSNEDESNNPWLQKHEQLLRQAILTEYQVKREFHNHLYRQADKATEFTLLSPAAIYNLLMLRFARTGVDEYKRFLDGILLYWQINLAYVYDSSERNRLLDDAPEFTYSPERFKERFFGSAQYFVVLFLLSIIFFLLAYTAFLRKDVR